MNELKFTTTSADITDTHYSNKTNDHFFQYLLMGIDKLHDFGDLFTKVYTLIYDEHFLYKQSNENQQLMGKKIIGTQEVVETSLKNKVSALHKIIDFMSYKTNSPIVGAPLLTFQSSVTGKTPILNVSIQAPQAIPPIKIRELQKADFRSKYKLQIPPQRDVLLYITGKQNDFLDPNSFTALKDILDIKSPEYISKDAFPMNSAIIDGIFDRSGKFQSYTSELMDPATQNKDIVPVAKNIKVLFCLLTGGKKLFLNATTNGKQISISFELNNKKTTTPFIITSKIPTPSIQDVVIYLYAKDWQHYSSSSRNAALSLKAMKQNYGAKIMNMFKKNNKAQNTLATKLEKDYFSKLFNAIPDLSKLTHEDRQLISLATKTIGDQTYLWDALINDSTPDRRSQNIHGSFVTTVDSFLFDQIVHGKNANAVFSSKSNGGLMRDALFGSIYQMVIYLKPLSEDLAESFLAEQAERIQSFNVDYQNEFSKLNKSTIQNGIINFKQKREVIVELLTTLFSKFIPQGRRIPSHYDYNGNRIEAFDISNYYYAACYLLHFIIQCEISLNKVNEYDPVAPDTLLTDITELEKQVNLIKSMNNSFKDAVSYYDDILAAITDESTLYNYLKIGEPVLGESSSLGLIVPQVGSAPDFESVKNSLNKNKARLDQNMGGIKIPATIGFSKGFFAIKGHVIAYFKGFSNQVLGGVGTKRKKSEADNTDPSSSKKSRTEVTPETEDEFKTSILKVFPQDFSDYIIEFGTGDTIPATHINPLDYYELFYLMKQLYYEDVDVYDVINPSISMQGGGKTADDFYVALYDFIIEDLPDFWKYIRDSIEMSLLIQKRKNEEKKQRELEIQTKRQKEWLKDTTMRTGFKPGSAPVLGNIQENTELPLAQTAGRKKTKRKHIKQNRRSNKLMKIKDRKSMKNKTKKNRKSMKNKTKNITI